MNVLYPACPRTTFGIYPGGEISSTKAVADLRALLGIVYLTMTLNADDDAMVQANLLLTNSPLYTFSGR